MADTWLTKLLQKPPTYYKVLLDQGAVAEVKIYKENDSSSPKYGLTLCWITIPKSHVKMFVNDIRRTGLIHEYYPKITRQNDIVIVNGGFFAFTDNHPIPYGLVISQGKTFNKISKSKVGGVLAQSHGTIEIIPIKSFRRSNSVEHAIQSKPILVFNGKKEIYSDDGISFNRTAIGFDRNNIIVAGAFTDSLQALTLYEFSAFLATKKKNGGPEVTAALNMDGAGGAHLILPTLDLHFGAKIEIYLPNTIHFSIIGEKK
jgi:uncharacterized protein YigE (DUF2233 family)